MPPVPQTCFLSLRTGDTARAPRSKRGASRCKRQRRVSTIGNSRLPPSKRFFGTLKRERANHVLYPSRKAAVGVVIRYIEMLHNIQHRRSYLSYRSSLEYETKAAA